MPLCHCKKQTIKLKSSSKPFAYLTRTVAIDRLAVQFAQKVEQLLSCFDIEEIIVAEKFVEVLQKILELHSFLIL